MQSLQTLSVPCHRLNARACRKREVRMLRRELRALLADSKQWIDEITEDRTQFAVSMLGACAAGFGGYQIVATFAALWASAVGFGILARAAKVRRAMWHARRLERNISNMQTSLMASPPKPTL